MPRPPEPTAVLGAPAGAAATTARTARRRRFGRMRRAAEPRRLAALVALTLAAALAGACGDDETDAALPELRVVAREGPAAPEGGERYHFEVPAQVPAGPMRMAFENTGGELHHAQLFKLAPGTTAADLRAALAEGGPPAAAQMGTFEGGTSVVDGGGHSSADALVELTPGGYALICFVEGPDGPHFGHGMIQGFEVTAGDSDAELPKPDVDIALFDYGFDAPETIARDAVVHMTNRSQQEPHEITIARLEGGATAGSVLEALATGAAPPATSVGGMQAILPGAGQSVQLALEPGSYAFLCSIPSASDGVPHHQKGMIRQVTVT